MAQSPQLMRAVLFRTAQWAAQAWAPALRAFATEALRPKFSSKYLIQHVSSKLIPVGVPS